MCSIKDAETVLEAVLRYLELDSSKEQRLAWLEAEDFPGGHAKCAHRAQKVDFGEWTKECTQIIESNAVMQRYRERKSVKERFT